MSSNEESAPKTKEISPDSSLLPERHIQGSDAGLTWPERALLQTPFHLRIVFLTEVVRVDQEEREEEVGDGEALVSVV